MHVHSTLNNIFTSSSASKCYLLWSQPCCKSLCAKSQVSSKSAMSASSGLQEVIKRIQNWEPQMLRLELVFSGTQKRACLGRFLGIRIKTLIHQRISHLSKMQKLIAHKTCSSIIWNKHKLNKPKQEPRT